MCFTTVGKPVIKIAAKDIVTYKLVVPDSYNEYCSIPRFFPYSIGKLVATGDLTSKATENVGNYWDYIQEKNMQGITNIHIVEGGLHSSVTIDRLRTGLGWDNRVILKCIIPKGSQYCTFKGLRISNALKPIKQMEL